MNYKYAIVYNDIRMDDEIINTCEPRQAGSEVGLWDDTIITIEWMGNDSKGNEVCVARQTTYEDDNGVKRWSSVEKRGE